MSSSVFPLLAAIPGQAIEVTRTAVWEGSEVVRAVSGKRTSISYWSNPIWEWTLKYNVLRAGTFQKTAFTEYQALVGFFNLRHGPYDSFLFDDTDDDTVTAQSIGTGDGSTTTFQLVRTMGSFVEPILAPHTITAVYGNGSPYSGGAYSVSSWGSATPGIVTFGSAPLNAVALTATFSYYWPVEFLDQTLSFNRFMTGLWSQDGVKLRSLK